MKVVEEVPLNRILVETDAPFLAPVPYRGKTCVPGHIAPILEILSKLKGVELQEMVKHTFQNTLEMFSLNNDE